MAVVQTSPVFDGKFDLSLPVLRSRTLSASETTRSANTYMLIVFLSCFLFNNWFINVGEANANDGESNKPDVKTIDFNRDIRPILSNRCTLCHGPDEEGRATDLRLDVADGAVMDLGGYAAVVPGSPDQSEIITRVTTEDEDLRMPPEGLPLSEHEVELLKQWILEGADYDQHWSYKPARKPATPKVDFDSTKLSEAELNRWRANPIDAFVLAKLQAHGLEPSPEATRLELARRLSLDLIGLPPTWEEAQAFANDERPHAYGRYVDSLLSKPTFGERWARVWLDLARYADSAGYADDPPREIWAYRDYVIRSLNENKPFDQFTIEQIAGDLLDDPTQEQLIATAFHRNTMTNSEGGTNDEEFRNAAVVDRVNTTMAVWMGTTMACAQCHTHKYDPITHEEYYQFFDFFNQTADADRRNEAPTLELWSAEQEKRKADLSLEIQKLEKELKQESSEFVAQRKEWFSNLSQPSWQRLIPKEVTSQSKRELIVDSGGVTRAQGAEPKKDTYQVKVDQFAGLKRLNALRIEIPTEQRENFVLSQVRARWIPNSRQPKAARYVRLSLPGKKRILHIAELEVIVDGKNAALDGKAKQSSVDYGGKAQFANDGNRSGVFEERSVTHTKTEDDPWLEIDLGSIQHIEEVVVWNRSDSEQIKSRLSGFYVELLDEQRELVWTNQSEPQKKVTELGIHLRTDGAQDLRFSHAQASFEQNGFAAATVIEDKLNPATGWAIAPRTGKDQHLDLLFAQPLELTSTGTLEITLKQQSKHLSHMILAFGLSASGDEASASWVKLPAKVKALVGRQLEQLSKDELEQVSQHYRSVSPQLKELHAKVEGLQKRLKSMRADSSVPIFQELPKDKQRNTFIQIRGNYTSHGDQVEAGTPAAFHKLQADGSPTRLDLAKWLVSPDNPLTARVIANRHWEQIFGTGIVETSEEFGSQGDLPSHPELLDYLATELVESGWDIKRLIKIIVMSAAYRQNSVASERVLKEDPFNRLISRGPRFRVSAEMVRDQALAVSGLLSPKMYGKPVRPPQPNLGLKAAFGSGTDWTTSQGEDKYRRGIYTNWRRSSPYPSMAQFDAPSRDVCTVRRIRTNTPLQALVTLNDPVYVEAAQALARRVIAQGSNGTGRVQWLYRHALVRNPSESETKRILQLTNELMKTYQRDEEQAQAMATDPLGKLPDGAVASEYAAWTVACNVVLNLDELFLKR